MYCKYCGNKVDDDSLFCSSCGKNLSLSEENEINPEQSLEKEEIVNNVSTKEFKHPKNVIELLDLDIETRANIETKILPIPIGLFIILGGLSLALYYWFGDDFLFSYFDVPPFGGFIVFIILTYIVLCISTYFYKNIVWGEYNDEIRKAQEEIEQLIINNNGTPEEIERMRKAHIERILIAYNKQLSEEDFKWHTSRVCWGCGKEHKVTPVPYNYHITKNISWKEGAIRKFKTLSKSATINICPECKNRFLLRGWVGETKYDFDKIPAIAKFKSRY